jgi:hypothetical protein
VTVFSPPPGGGISSAITLTVANPAPTLAGLGQGSVRAGDPPFELVVSGLNLEPNSVVEWNGGSRVTTYVSSNTLRAAILSTDLAAAGSALIDVATPGPGGGVSAQQNFIILPPLPLNLAQVKVFPNPLNLRSANTPMFNFANIPASAQIRIFTVSGHWVRNIESPNGVANWDLTNNSGQPVASGVYLYIVTDSQGDSQRGVIALAR